MSYSTAVGKFLERDPLGYVDGLDEYEIEKSNPVKYVDPTGHAAFQGPRPTKQNDPNTQPTTGPTTQPQDNSLIIIAQARPPFIIISAIDKTKLRELQDKLKKGQPRTVSPADLGAIPNRKFNISVRCEHGNSPSVPKEATAGANGVARIQITNVEVGSSSIIIIKDAENENTTPAEVPINNTGR